MDFSEIKMEKREVIVATVVVVIVVVCVSSIHFGLNVTIYQSILQSIREQNINCICGSKLCTAKRVN